MTRRLSKDTQLCISLAGRPGNHGTRFHNALYDELDLDFVYKACTTTDLTAAIGGLRALGIRGCSVSMPFKEDAIPLVDELDDSARAIQSINTIVNDGGRLRAYNTDYLAVASLLAAHQVPTDADVAVLGSGGMAKAVTAALGDGGFPRCRRGPQRAAGSALAEQYGYRRAPELEDKRPAVLVNATPVGMAGGPDADRLPVPEEAVDAASVVFEVVAMPVETPLVRRARRAGAQVITGAEVIALQAAEQFALYTGVRPTKDQIRGPPRRPATDGRPAGSGGRGQVARDKLRPKSPAWSVHQPIGVRPAVRSSASMPSRRNLVLIWLCISSPSRNSTRSPMAETVATCAHRERSPTSSRSSVAFQRATWSNASTSKSAPSSALSTRSMLRL